MKYWNFIQNAEDVELRISGEIVSDDDVWVYELLGIETTSPNEFKDELKNYKGKDITVWIDSYGGDVFAAAGIYNALMEHKEHKGNVTVKVDGKAMSAASVITMAGGVTLMSPVSIIMIHNPWTGVMGDMHELRHVAEILDEVKDTLINAYQLKTGLSRKKISEMMDSETFMSAKAAIKYGFADKMMYAEKDEVIAADFSFSRLAIQNNAKLSMNRLINIQKEHTKEKPNNNILKAKLELKLKL